MMMTSKLIPVAATALIVSCWMAQSARAELPALPEEERATLLALFEASGPSDTLIERGWGGEPGTECEDWVGVFCNFEPENRVMALDLSDAELSGELPDLSELIALNHLALANNQVQPLPAELWPPNLVSLDLQGNQLEQFEPAQMPPGLVELNLSVNRLTLTAELITALSDAGLQRLDLIHNQMSGSLPELPAGLGLRELDLSHNLFNGVVPASWMQMSELGRLDLSHNRLDGQLPDPAPGDWPMLSQLNLSNNRLSGPLPAGFGQLQALRQLSLSRNQLSGSLPPELGQAIKLERLRLDHNQFDGELPEALDQLSLRQLDLANNQFEGDITPAFLALRPELPMLDVSGNKFSGDLPALVEQIEFIHPAEHGGSLNLCFNDLSIGDQALADFVAEYHVAGAPDDCLGRERVAMSPDFSGSWFVPGRGGEGFSLQLTDRGELLAYWFGYDLDGSQRWFFGNDRAAETSASLQQIWTTAGQFGEGMDFITSAFLDELFEQPPVRQLLRFHPLDTNRAIVERPQARTANCLTPDMFPNCRGASGTWRQRQVLRLEHRRLTRLAGARCEQQQVQQQWISGAWFDPSREGEGFLVEVNQDGRGVAYWFTYEADGSGRQAWMIGEGHFDGSTLIIEQLHQPASDELGPDFEPVNIELLDWGRLEMHFEDDDQGTVFYESAFAEFGSGTFPIVRLARPMLADCTAD